MSVDLYLIHRETGQPFTTRVGLGVIERFTLTDFHRWDHSDRARFFWVQAINSRLRYILDFQQLEPDKDWWKPLLDYDTKQLMRVHAELVQLHDRLWRRIEPAPPELVDETIHLALEALTTNKGD